MFNFRITLCKKKYLINYCTIFALYTMQVTYLFPRHGTTQKKLQACKNLSKNWHFIIIHLFFDFFQLFFLRLLFFYSIRLHTFTLTTRDLFGDNNNELRTHDRDGERENFFLHDLELKKKICIIFVCALWM